MAVPAELVWPFLGSESGLHLQTGVQDYLWGWRFSLAFACLFAALFFAGTVIAPDSPNSLLLNGKTEKATQVTTPVAPHGRLSQA